MYLTTKSKGPRTLSAAAAHSWSRGALDRARRAVSTNLSIVRDRHQRTCAAIGHRPSRSLPALGLPRRLALAMRNPRYCTGDVLGRQDEIHKPAGDRALGHVRLPRCVGLLRNGDAANVLDSTERRCPIAVITGDNDSDQFAVPVLGQGTQKDCDDIRPPSRLLYWLQMKFVIRDVQIAARRDYENAIGAYC